MPQLVYSDFNSIVKLDDGSDYLDLCGYGTLASLSHQKIRLKEGMELILYEPGDIESDASVHFFSNERDNNNPKGKWFAKLLGSLRDNHMSYEDGFVDHVCFKCRKSLKEHFRKVGGQYKESCPDCGTSVMYPLSPPTGVGFES